MMHLQESWGMNVILDLFLGGMGAAAFILALYDYLKGERELSLKVAFAGVISLILGLLFLVSHLGKPEAAFHVFLSPNTSSVMTYGVFFNILFLVFGGLFVLPALLPKLPYSGKAGAMKLLGVIGGVFALLVMIYTGLLIARTSYPLWRNPAVPLLFVLTALSAGAGLYILVAEALKKTFPSRLISLSLLTTFLAFLAFTSMLLLVDIAPLAYRESVHFMLSENLAATMLLYLVGFAAPFLVSLAQRGRSSKALTLVLALALILQALLCRYLVVSSAFMELPW
ncbi:MAG: NrfD/PsrC family molybdoenzyme membrane anchor subunit [Thermofilum sp.]